MRKSAVFGKDTDVFRPERWLEATEDQRSEMRHTVELVFGYGRWACAGKPIAFVELNKIFVEVSAARTGQTFGYLYSTSC